MQRAGKFDCVSSIAAKVPGLLFAAAMLTSLPVVFFATPILDPSEAPAHVHHDATLYLHVIGGLAVMVAGGGSLHRVGEEGFQSS
jgi:Na+-driven multidrug efflux pump